MTNVYKLKPDAKTIKYNYLFPSNETAEFQNNQFISRFPTIIHVHKYLKITI